MKYVIVQGDGMSDYGVESLGWITPLEAARTPHMDSIADRGRVGRVRTIPPGFPSGTDVGTMTILGCDPARYHTGRSPIEAASMGIELADGDVAFRCNLVTLSGGEGHEVMDDFTAGHVSSEDAGTLITALQDRLGDEEISFHAGVSYRHLMLWGGGPDSLLTTPPHDISDRPVAAYRARGEGSDRLAMLADEAHRCLAAHPINLRKSEAGEKPATDIWLWGQGRRPALPTLGERYGLKGAVITAVDVVSGLGRLVGMERVDVPGITGFVDTDYLAKGRYALDALDEYDLVFIHVEAPDEAGHMGDAELKVRAIEDLDEKVVGTLLDGMGRYDDWRILVLPDHATPVSTKTHTDDLVPFAMCSSRCENHGGSGYNEKTASAGGDVVEEGHLLLEQFLDAS